MRDFFGNSRAVAPSFDSTAPNSSNVTGTTTFRLIPNRMADSIYDRHDGDTPSPSFQILCLNCCQTGYPQTYNPI